MPVSTSVHISHCLALIIQLNPRSVLDVGCGFGTWGFLCRTYLDVCNERVQPDQWQVRIDGLELFEPYIQPHHRALYTSLLIGDIRERASKLDEYELIVAGDVIEHLEKAEGEALIEQLYEKATRALLVNIPLGEGWDHPERHGNPGELHRSTWWPEDFLAYPSFAATFDLPCGKYGVFYCPKDCTPQDRVRGLCQAAEYADARGDLPATARHLRRAHALDRENHDVILFLADVLIRSGAPDDAATLLARAVEENPGNHEAGFFLAKLLAARTRRAEAQTCLERLLAMADVSPATRQEASRLLETLSVPVPRIHDSVQSE